MSYKIEDFIVEKFEKMSLVQRLLTLADRLEEIELDEYEPETVEEFFKKVSGLIDLSTNEIAQKMSEITDVELPENQKEYFIKTDEKFVDSLNFLSDSANLLEEYINSRDKELIKKSRDAVSDGVAKLEQGRAEALAARATALTQWNPSEIDDVV